MTPQPQPPKRLAPKFTYNGLTILMSNPSRFDKSELLTANGGEFFLNECLRPDVNKFQCDIRTMDCKDPLMAGTKVILALGAEANALFSKHSLGEQRGSPFVDPTTGIIYISSYLPQDAVDYKDYEGDFNPLLQSSSEGDDGYTNGLEDDEPEEDAKKHGKTSRTNWRFWLQRDTKKAIRIAQADGKLAKSFYAETEYVIYPAAVDVIKILTETKNSRLYVDIETDYERNMLCFAFAFSVHRIYVVPCLGHDYRKSYDRLAEILRALSVALRDNEVIAHNGAGFDFVVFAEKYRLPVGRKLYDTMLATHRCFPEVEKSLGHCISLWTDEPYHKDEGAGGYYTPHDAQKMWLYCGKDVSSMIKVREAIDAYADTRGGLAASIAQANASIRPYLTTCLQGIAYNKEKLKAIMVENDRLMTQYLRCMTIMTGPDVPPLISNQKCCKYFHDMMQYPVVGRSKKTKMPSLAEGNLLKLKLKAANPVIDFLLLFRRLKKESGSLKFTPWIGKGVMEEETI